MNTKRCSGYKKHWECADDYPNHMVPVSKFGINRGVKDGLQFKCRKCMSYRKKTIIRNGSVPKHPVTNQVKWIWKHKRAESYGGIQNTPDWKSYLDKAEEQWRKEVPKDVIYNIATPFNLSRTKRKLPKVDRPKSIRVTTKKVVDSRGYVYIFKDYMKPDGLYKIGASHEPHERLDQANTWGDFASIYESEEVADCAKIEKEVHQFLRKWNVKGEWFNIPEVLAINKTKEIVNESFNYAVAS